MSGNDKKKSKKTMWIILIILVLIIIFYLYKQKNENMTYDNRLLCDEDPVTQGCFAQNLTGSIVGPRWNNKTLKLYLMKCSYTITKDDHSFDCDPFTSGASRPSKLAMICYFRSDFIKQLANNFKTNRDNTGDFNLIVYEMKYKISNDIRFAYMAVLHDKTNQRVFVLTNDNKLYTCFIDLNTGNDRIIDVTSNKTHQKTFITLSNNSEISSWSLEQQNGILEIIGKNTGRSRFNYSEIEI